MRKNIIVTIKEFCPIILVFILSAALLLVFTAKVMGQETMGAVVVQSYPDGSKIISTTVKNLNGKSYINWLVKGQEEDCLFAIFKSHDGANYELLNFKQGTGTGVNVPLLYCYTDSCATAAIQYYKIKIYTLSDIDNNNISVLSENNPLDLTEIVSVNNDNHTPYKISFFNTYGIRVLNEFSCERKESGNYLDKPGSLDNGIYLLAVSANENIDFKKIIIR